MLAYCPVLVIDSTYFSVFHGLVSTLINNIVLLIKVITIITLHSRSNISFSSEGTMVLMFLTR